MEENKLIEKPKLNFFQRWRKNRLIKKIDYSRYEKAPDYLKNDDEVILELVTKNPNNINRLELGRQLDLLKINPDFFGAMMESKKWSILKVEPMLLSKMTEEEVFKYIHENYTGVLNGSQEIEFVKYISEDVQYKLLTKKYEYYRNDLTKKKCEPSAFFHRLQYFSPNVIEKVMIHYIEQAKKLKEDTWEEKRKKESFLTGIKIDNFPMDLQLKLILLDPENLKEAPIETVERYVAKNPMIIKLLKENQKVEIIRKNPDFLNTLSWGEKRNFFGKYDFIRQLASDEDKLIFSDLLGEQTKITDINAVKNFIIRDNEFSVDSKITDHVKDSEMLIELGRFRPEILATWGQDNFKAYKKIGYTVNLYKILNKDPKVTMVLDNLPKRLSQIDTRERNDITSILPKVLLNEKIISKVSSELIVKFIQDPESREILEQIVSQTYGEDALAILKERPQVSLQQIPCLEIFEPIVLEKFGKGTIDNFMSYSSNTGGIFGDIIRNPEKLKKFEEFSRVFGADKENMIGFNDKLISYQRFGQLLNSININDLTEKQKSNLILASNDMFMKNKLQDNELKMIMPTTIQELEEYDIIRNKIYDEYVQKSVSIDGIKDAISKRFFGMSYEPDLQLEYQQTSLSLNSMIYYYNLENFVKDERTINSGEFSQDELDMLEIATILSKVNDPSALREIYSTLALSNEILRPEDFDIARRKIPVQYSKELVDSLLTVENAKQRAESGEHGISYQKTEDGVEIINLSGADFRIMVHTTGLNNSKLSIPYSSDWDCEKIWKHFEKGCSTISCCMIEPEMLNSCADERKINLGFSSIPPTQIIGMSHHDALVSHKVGEVDPDFKNKSVRFNYTDELMRKTAAQITDQEPKDSMHPYNEVAMYRRYIDENAEEYGQRVMPDYIVVYGEATEAYKDLAKKYSKDGKPIPIIGIDTKAYGDRTFARGHMSRKEDHTMDRKTRDTIKDVKEIVEKNLEYEVR